MNAQANARRVRRRQLFLLIIGVLGALVVPLTVMGDVGLIGSFVGSLSVLLIPVAYYRFARSVQSAVADIAGPSESQVHKLAIATFVPMVGAIVEVVVLYRLAQETARIEGAQDRSSAVVGLAVARLLLGSFIGPMAAGAFISMSSSLVMYGVVYGTIGLLAFSLLGLASQMIVMPILDDLAPAPRLDLAAAGAGGSAAVSSEVRAPARAE